MKLKPKLLSSLLVAAALVPAAAWAELAVTVADVNMRAGPDASYPRVATLGRGVTVDVVGCVEGWQWCDVIVGPNRGFVAANYLSYGSYGYANPPVVISQGGPALGIPLIAFSIGNYWDSYYRGRPWWKDRDRWYSHRVAPAPAWRGSPGYAWGHDDRHGNDWRRNDGRNNDWRGGDHRNDDWRGGDRGRGHADRGDRDRNGLAPGPIPGPYTRSEGGQWERPGGSRPNDQNHPNQQQ